MENEEMIRRQMEQTRTSLTEKLETLENEVVQTVQGATEAVAETVETIKETVSDTVCTVKETVEDTVGAVKQSVSDSVATVKDYLDVRGYVEAHPWLMLGGSVAAGYCLGAWLGRRSAPQAVEAAARPSDGPRPQQARNGRHHEARSHRRRHEDDAPVASWLASFAPEISQLKGLALGTLFGAARDMIRGAVQGEAGERLAQIVDDITAKVGGEPVSLPQQSASSGYVAEEHQEDHDETAPGAALASQRYARRL